MVSDTFKTHLTTGFSQKNHKALHGTAVIIATVSLLSTAKSLIAQYVASQFLKKSKSTLSLFTYMPTCYELSCTRYTTAETSPNRGNYHGFKLLL